MINNIKLNNNDKNESFLSAQAFVEKVFGHRRGGETTCWIFINGIRIVDKLEVSFFDYVPAYSFLCDVFLFF